MGTRRPGAVDKFHVDTQSITETVATDTEAKGLFEDALKLFDLAGVSVDVGQINLGENLQWASIQLHPSLTFSKRSIIT